MSEHLFYVAAYGPMHARGAWTAYLIAESEEQARELAQAEAPEGYGIERIREQIERPAAVLKDTPVLN